MKSRPERHSQLTASLAKKLRPKDVFQWLVTEGYFPEPYVLPPCFSVREHRDYGKALWKIVKKGYGPRPTELLSIHFPKSDWTDRVFGIIDPNIHYDIALNLARNWKTVTATLFGGGTIVQSYSFPIPLNSKTPGYLGSLRAGRLVYEFIEMAERDLASEAYRFRCLLKTDVKNFYPSVYTHSIAWALHGKKQIRRGDMRFDCRVLGNRLDKLFQNANDGCTNGIPIGPAVSDLIAEIVLSGVDRELTRRVRRDNLSDRLLIVRFKDDYWLLADSQEAGRSAIKHLQSALKEFRLELNDEKTVSHIVPDGLFRPWVSQYYTVNPRPHFRYSLKRFREVCLGVIRIDRENPSCGVVDRFLADIVGHDDRLRVTLTPASLDIVVSLVLMLARLRTKVFPKSLSILEIILRARPNHSTRGLIAEHLAGLMRELVSREAENTYLIAWIVYFMRTNGMDEQLGNHDLRDPVTRAVYTSRFPRFRSSTEFKVFEGVKSSAKRVSLQTHLRMFPPRRPS